MQLDTLQGLGPKRISALNAQNIFCVQDLLLWLPRGYIDFSHPKPIFQLSDGEDACVAVQVAGPVWESRRSVHTLKVPVRDESGYMTCLFFNQPYLKQKLHLGTPLRLFGRAQRKFGEVQMVCPAIAGQDVSGVMPVYPGIEGIPQKTLRELIAQSLTLCDIPETLPPRLLQQYDLMPRAQALGALHVPKDMEELKKARYRMAFEELVLFQMAIRKLRGERHKKNAVPIFAPSDLVQDFWSSLPFAPTSAQRRTLSEIVTDMQKSTPMARLVQGDVGSGKTAVAAGALLCAAKAGFQSAMMAPTEILANQHADSLQNMLSPFGVRVALLTANIKPAERKVLLQKLKNNGLDVLVGTHALIQPDVCFSKLGLVVADEQHRFGVRQRQALADKGQDPHMLVMSATPIPRSLALILYGDLDISIIDEMPPGRLPVKTHLVPEQKRTDMYAFVRQQINAGRQAYVVCPLVEESESLDARAAQSLVEELKTTHLSGLSVDLLHGRMTGAQKDQVMSGFSSGQTAVLVSTTVIEVGVNVQNASVMVIENAERFGLAQLHQLRGRVGRGTHESFCFLLGGGAGFERLQFLAQTNDGFAVAEQDLAQRGPGDFLGSRQSGLADARLAGLASDVQLLSRARESVDLLLSPGWQQELDTITRAATQRYQHQIREVAIH